MTLRKQQEYLVCNHTFSFLPYYCVHFLIATNRIAKPFTALRQQQEYLARNRTFPFLPYYCVHSPIAANRITKPFMALRNSRKISTEAVLSRSCRITAYILRLLQTA